MERENRARGQDKAQSQRQTTPEAPRLEGAAADLARAMSMLPRAELDMPPEQLSRGSSALSRARQGHQSDPLAGCS